MAVVRLAGPAAFIPSWLNPFSANIRDTQQPEVSRQATSSLGPGGIKQPPACDTCLGSEIAIDKTESWRPAVGRYPVVAPPGRHGAILVEVGCEIQQLVFEIGGCPEQRAIQALPAKGANQTLYKRMG